MQLLDVNQAARVGPHGLERGLLGEVLPRVLQQNGLFLSFPCVCPESVLVNSSFSYINGAKRPFFHRGAVVAGAVACKKNA